jgi:hypothetical protein
MSGAIHPLPQYAFMACYLAKAQGQLYIFFTFLLYKEKQITVLYFVALFPQNE